MKLDIYTAGQEVQVAGLDFQTARNAMQDLGNGTIVLIYDSQGILNMIVPPVSIIRATPETDDERSRLSEMKGIKCT